MTALSLLLCAGSADAAAPGCTLQKYAELPVTMAGFRPLLQARINGAPVRLFIDTGSFWGMLSPASASRLGLHVRAGHAAIAVTGLTGTSEVGLTQASEFDLGDNYKAHNVDFLVAEHNLGAADGLIGQNLMGAADVEYDLANGVVRLFEPKDCGRSDLGYWSAGGSEMLPIDEIALPSNQIRGTATLNGVKIKVVFDTGTPRSLITLAAARRAGVRTDGPDVTALGFSAGVGRRVIDTWLAPFKTFEIGGEQVQATRLRVADIDLPAGDMLLGADFFLSHRIYVAKSQSRIYFTYNGGPVFDFERVAAAQRPEAQTPAAGPPATQTPAPTAGAPAAAIQPSPGAAPAEADDTPRDAAGFTRRAAAFLTREEFAKAIADLSSAIALEPGNAALYTDRGLAYLRDRQPILAMADFDQTIKLHPDAPRALLARGELRLAARDEAGARADFASVLRLTPGAALAVGGAYVRAGLYADAVTALDLAIDGKPKTEDMAGAFLARCRARGLWGQQLDQALDDCNQAMRLMPGGSAHLQTRGLVYLRQGRLDAAIADFDAALRLQPKDPWSLYGRSAAERGQGEADKAAADLAAALALDPSLPDRLKALGLAP
jgi:tetratricopeptide (TPR) repeat protein/predicted aspartyl protease